MSALSGGGFFIIIFSFFVAIILSILPLPVSLQLLQPQWLLLVTIYWIIALPHRVSLGTAWLMGLLLDVLYGSMLGEHALLFLIVAYGIEKFYRQFRVASILQQAITLFLLMLIYQGLLLWLHGMLGELTSSHLFWVSPILSMIVWPWIYGMLQVVRRQFRIY